LNDGGGTDPALRLWNTSKETSEAAEPLRNTATESPSGKTEAASILEPFSTVERKKSVTAFRGRRVDESESNASKVHDPPERIVAKESEVLTEVIGIQLTGYASAAVIEVSAKSLLKMHSNRVAKPSLSPQTNQSRFLS
jgi:hypothetical protein